MDEDGGLVRYEIWQYNPQDDAYKLAQRIDETDIYKWDYTQASGIEYNVLDVELKRKAYDKANDNYMRFVPRSRADTEMIEPIIMKKMRYVAERAWSEYEALIFEYEEITDGQRAHVRFVGYDIKKLESLKLITTNKNFNHIKEPEDSESDTTEKVELPITFAKYVRTSQVKTILTELYESAFVAPRTIEYGALGVRDKTRNVKGLGTVDIAYEDAKIIETALEQIPLLEAKEIIFSHMMYPLETYFESNDGKINVEVRAGRFIENSLIRKKTNILEHAYTYKQGVNYIASHGKANVTHHERAVKTIDFSSYEVQEDFATIAGNSKDKLDQPTKSALKKQLQEAREFLTLKVHDPFSFIRAGDYFEFDFKLYTIKQIKETIQANSPVTYGFEIEERGKEDS